jgi:DNA-binding transcriptional LysR family regulator
MSCDYGLGPRHAVGADLGVGVCQLGLARREPDLVCLLPADFSVELDVWVVMHKDLRASHRMRLMFDHLATELAVYVASAREKPAKRVRA